MRKLFSLALFVLIVCLFGGAAVAQTVPGLISYQGRLNDVYGAPVTGTVPMAFTLWDKPLTQDPVTNEAVTLTGTTPAALAHQRLVAGLVVITAAGGVPTYVSPRDYSVDLVSGTITRNPTGFILSGQQVEVDYVWNNLGTMVWSELRAVEVQNGIYSVLLGAAVPLPENIFTDPSLFLEVTIASDTLSPRAPLTSVAYAMGAALLGGHPASDFALGSHSHNFSAITGSVTDAQVPDTITVLYANDAGTLEGMYASDFAPATHTHAFNAITGTVTDAQVPDNISILYAAEAGSLDGMYASDFAPIDHSHTLQGLMGAVTDAQVPDNITVTLANNSAMLGGLLPAAYVLVAGDTVTGALQVNGALQARSGLSVLAGGVGVGQVPTAGYGIDNALGTAPTYGARLRGSTYGLMAEYSARPTTQFAYLAGNTLGIKVASGNTTTAVNYATGGEFNSLARSRNYGVRANSTSYSEWGVGVMGTGIGFMALGVGGISNATGLSYGVQGTATGTGTSDVAGGYFAANPDGSGNRMGVYATAIANDSADVAYGIKTITYNTDPGATTYGGYFWAANSPGNNYGVYASSYDFAAYFVNTSATNRSVAVGQPGTGVQVSYGNTFASTAPLTGLDVDVAGIYNLYGANILVNSYATSGSNVWGVRSEVDLHSSQAIGFGGYFLAAGGDTGNRYGVYALAMAGDTTAASYGVYGYATNTRGPAYGVYGNANSNKYAGYFENGKVRIGSAGTENYVDGSGDLYVADETESGSYYYHAAQAGYYAVSLVGSAPDQTKSPWRADNFIQYCNINEACYSYYPVNLPSRATVTAFRVWANTTEAVHNFTCILARRSINSYSYAEMATVSSTTTAMTLADTGITWPYVDNQNMSYFVYCTETDNTRTANVSIYGIRIDYTVEGPE